MTELAGGTRSTTAAGLTFVTAGSMIANIAGYLMHVTASRWLGVDGYSEFAALLAAQLVLAVPALALQNVLARERVRGVDSAQLRLLATRCAALVAVLGLIAVPGVVAGLRVGAVAAFAALLTAPVYVLLAGEQGIMQGEGRFRELGAFLTLGGALRVAPAVALLAIGAGTSAALMAAAAGTTVAAAAARLWNRRSERTGVRTTVGLQTVLAASQLQLAMIVLTSLDLLLARAVLIETDASIYGLGAVASKVAFWLPQAISIVLYPQFAAATGSVRALRSALLMLTGIGALVVVGIAVCAPLAPMVAGRDYQPVTGLLWLFALQGAVLAIVQCALTAAVAVDRTHAALVAWCGLAIEAALILTIANGSLERVLSIAVSCATAVAVVTVAVALAVHARRG